MAKYYYDGETVMRFPDKKSVKFDIQTIIEARSLHEAHEAYSYLADLIRCDTNLEFNGTMTKANPYPEKDDKRIEELEKKVKENTNG